MGTISSNTLFLIIGFAFVMGLLAGAIVIGRLSVSKYGPRHPARPKLCEHENEYGQCSVPGCEHTYVVRQR